jgi:hypothetical protein
MTCLTVCFATLLVLQSGALKQNPRPDDGSFRMRVEGCADLTYLNLSYYITGPFGGYGGFGEGRGVRDYTLPLSHNNQPAASLKVIIICPGHRAMVLDERAPFPPPSAVKTVRLESLGLLPVSGRVAAKALKPGLVVETRYRAYWSHAFFGITDGAYPHMIVSSTSVSADGTFALQVPDFARDPVVQSYPAGIRGVFVLTVKEVATGHFDPRADFELPIATQYSPVVLGALRPADDEGGQ